MAYCTTSQTDAAICLPKPNEPVAVCAKTGGAALYSDEKRTLFALSAGGKEWKPIGAFRVCFVFFPSLTQSPQCRHRTSRSKARACSNAQLRVQTARIGGESRARSRARSCSSVALLVVAAAEAAAASAAQWSLEHKGDGKRPVSASAPLVETLAGPAFNTVQSVSVGSDGELW
jgi:hypothetical protein